MSPSNVRLAFRELHAAGMITSIQGRGTFVRSPVPRITRDATSRYAEEKRRAALTDPDERAPMVAEIDSPGVKPEDVTVEAAFAEVEANEDLAERFGIEVGHQLLERTYETTIAGPGAGEGDHMNLIRSYLRRDLIEANPDLLDESKEPWPGGTFHQMRTVGIEIDRIVDEIIARPPTLTEASAFDAVGVAVIEILKTSIDTDDRVVEISIAVYPGDRTKLKYTTQLERWE